jgi:hypothetical protein
MMKGREAEALVTLARLHARGNQNDAFVQAEFGEMKLKLADEVAHDGGWAEIFLDKTNLRKLMLGITLQFSVQMTGVSAIQYYAP